jgi:hypothetical protein
MTKSHLSKLTKLHKNEALKSSRFNRSNLAVFTVIFAFVAGYFIFHSFAATPTACRAVGPAATGTGSGLDWNNRMALPNAPSRGLTYYLMDGSYGAYSPSTANSGTTRIVIKKAQTYDFGRIADNCTNDISAGWNDASMGSAQAAFTSVDSGSAAGYYTFDGNGQANSVSCGASPAVNTGAKDCGIKVAEVGHSNSTHSIFNINSTRGGGTRASGWTLRYLEIAGAGTAEVNDTNAHEHTMWCDGGCDDMLVEHNYFHDSACDFMEISYGNNVVIDHNHFRVNHSSATCHGQLYLGSGTIDNFTWSNNLMQDVTGTAVWSILNGGHGSNWNIYNNILFGTNGTAEFHTSGGIVAVINPGSVMVGLNFYNNTVINNRPDYNGSGGIKVDNSGTSITWQNNLFYSGLSQQNGNPLNYSIPGGATLTLGYNTYLNTGTASPSGTGDVTVTSAAPNPFVDWPNYDFRLATQNAYWSNGLSLSAPFNVDFAGSARPDANSVWNRGAYQYATNGTTPPPPTNPPPTVNLSANPTTIASGGSSTLTWSSSNATSCSATSPSGWTASTTTSGSQAVSPTSTTTYTITCTGAGGSSSANSTVTVSLANGCLQSTTSWQNNSLAAQTSTFTFDFDATPSANNIDTITGLSNGSATGYPSLAVIVRFNSSGTIDAVNDTGQTTGGNYTAVSSIPYASGISYHFKLTVNPATHTYNATVTPSGGSATTLATNYGFRFEQRNTSSLNNWVLYSLSGSESVCNPTLNQSTGPKQGDINNDNSVNITDLSLLLSSYNQNVTQCTTNNTYKCDLSSPGDGVVNIFDLSILLSHYGT